MMVERESDQNFEDNWFLRNILVNMIERDWEMINVV